MEVNIKLSPGDALALFRLLRGMSMLVGGQEAALCKQVMFQITEQIPVEVEHSK